MGVLVLTTLCREFHDVTGPSGRYDIFVTDGVLQYNVAINKSYVPFTNNDRSTVRSVLTQSARTTVAESAIIAVASKQPSSSTFISGYK